MRIVAGDYVMRESVLRRLIPRWSDERVEALRVTGQSGRNIDNWILPNQVPTIFEQKLILGLVMEIGILIAMGSHVYKFTGKFFFQLLGGPIGLNVTAWAASIVMKCFDNIWTALLRSNNVDLLAYLRYVDDSRSFNKRLQERGKMVKRQI